MGQKQFIWLCTKFLMLWAVVLIVTLLLDFDEAWFLALLIDAAAGAVMCQIYFNGIAPALEKERETEKTEINT